MTTPDNKLHPSDRAALSDHWQPGAWRPTSLGPENVPSSERPPPVEGRATPAELLLLQIFRRFPSKTSIFTDRSENAKWEYENECEWPFWRYFGRGPELFTDRDVLDLGCGYGGRPMRWLDVGARTVCGVEVSETQVVLARAFAKDREAEDRSEFLIGIGEAIPCEDQSFDLVVMNDVMEHVIAPEQVVAECYRVLRPSGRLAAVFPPYYDIFGGSHLHGYATSIPGLNLVFTTRTLKRATRRFFFEEGIDHRPYMRDIPTDKLWNMNGLTLRRFERIVDRSPFEIEQLWLMGHFDRRLLDPSVPASSRWRAVVRPAAYALSDALTRNPCLREVLCSRVCAVLQKLPA